MKYIRFQCELMTVETVSEETSLNRVPTVGEVLMQSARKQAKRRRENEEAQMSPQLPKKCDTPRHRKEELFNDIVGFLEER